MTTSNLPFATGNPTDFRQKLAEMMVSKGIDTSPVQSWTQGAARMANALVGGMQLNDLRNDQTAAGDFQSKLALLMMGGAGGGGASVSPVTPSMPSVTTPGPTVPNDSNAMLGQVGMDLRLADRSQDFLQDNPGTTMSSGVRSTADQQRLYDNRASNPNPVARPGTSNHERGMAVDIAGMTPEQRTLLPQYGLAQPVANDPPHVELAPTPAPYQVAGPAVAPPQAPSSMSAPATSGTISPDVRRMIAEGLQSKNPMIKTMAAQQAIKLGDPSTQIGLALKQAQLEKIRRENNTAGNEVYGTPIFGTDANGNPVVGAIGKNGAFKQLDTNGVKISTGVDKIDLGTQYAIYDKKSGQLIGYQPKDLKGAEAAKAEGKAQGTAVSEYQSITSKMPGLETTVRQLDDLANRATYTTAGQMVDAAGRQLGLAPRDAAIARAEYVSKVDNQILPLLRDTFGAQFTEREGATLRGTLGDPNKSPQEKQAVLRSFIEQKRRDVEAMGARIGRPAPTQSDTQGEPGWQDVGGVKIRRKQ